MQDFFVFLNEVLYILTFECVCVCVCVMLNLGSYNPTTCVISHKIHPFFTNARQVILLLSGEPVTFELKFLAMTLMSFVSEALMLASSHP